MPAGKHVILVGQLDGLRCGSLVREPGGLKEHVVHEWHHEGKLVTVQKPELMRCDGTNEVFRSTVPADLVPADPVGTWTCTTKTVGGQLVGKRSVSVEAPPVGGGGAGERQR
jgi:hypothetical protein